MANKLSYKNSANVLASLVLHALVRGHLVKYLVHTKMYMFSFVNFITLPTNSIPHSLKRLCTLIGYTSFLSGLLLD